MLELCLGLRNDMCVVEQERKGLKESQWKLKREGLGSAWLEFKLGCRKEE